MRNKIRKIIYQDGDKLEIEFYEKQIDQLVDLFEKEHKIKVS